MYYIHLHLQSLVLSKVLVIMSRFVLDVFSSPSLCVKTLEPFGLDSWLMFIFVIELIAFWFFGFFFPLRISAGPSTRSRAYTWSTLSCASRVTNSASTRTCSRRASRRTSLSPSTSSTSAPMRRRCSFPPPLPVFSHSIYLADFFPCLSTWAGPVVSKGL